MCNSIFSQIIPCRTNLYKKLDFTNKFMKMILSFEKIALSYIQLNKMIDLLSPNDKNKLLKPYEELEYIYEFEKEKDNNINKIDNCFEISLVKEQKIL